MRKRSSFSLVAMLTLLIAGCSQSNILTPDITVEELTQHINYLASDELQGRQPGTPGDLAAAEYIRDNLKSFGLKPFKGNGLQEFELVSSVVAGDNNSFIAEGISFEPGTDFMPFAFSENLTLESKVVFAGYGFEIDEKEIIWDDFAAIDITEKWVLILRADPEVDNAMSDFAPYSSDRDKCMIAKDKGAGGVLLVSGVAFDQKDEFEPLARGENSVGIPVLRITRILADQILLASGKSITQLENELNTGRSPMSFETEIIVKATSELQEEKLTTRNVVMKLDGNDPSLTNQYVIVGGHFDHLGLGGASSRTPDSAAVHFGADDNASGIAAIIEIAEKAAASGLNGRTIIFAAFAAEEMGLLGSKYLVENLPVDPANVNAMINLDMVGRLKESRELSAGGVGTAAGLRDLIYSNIDTTSFNLAISEEGFGPSDHSSFYGKDIPVLYFSTGAHLDYHTPSDTPEKINYSGLSEIANIVSNITHSLSVDTAKLQFTEAGPKTQVSRGTRRKGVTLGIMPDFAGSVKNGLRADLVTPGRPAALGGMKKGDIIKSINGMKINNIQDYMFRLSKLNQGETISVEVDRDGEMVVLLVTL